MITIARYLFMLIMLLNSSVMHSQDFTFEQELFDWLPDGFITKIDYTDYARIEDQKSAEILIKDKRTESFSFHEHSSKELVAVYKNASVEKNDLLKMYLVYEKWLEGLPDEIRNKAGKNKVRFATHAVRAERDTLAVYVFKDVDSIRNEALRIGYINDTGERIAGKPVYAIQRVGVYGFFHQDALIFSNNKALLQMSGFAIDGKINSFRFSKPFLFLQMHREFLSHHWSFRFERRDLYLRNIDVMPGELRTDSIKKINMKTREKIHFDLLEVHHHGDTRTEYRYYFFLDEKYMENNSAVESFLDVERLRRGYTTSYPEKSPDNVSVERRGSIIIQKWEEL